MKSNDLMTIAACLALAASLSALFLPMFAPKPKAKGINGSVVFDPMRNLRQAHELRHADANLGWQFGCAYALGATNLSLEHLSNAIDKLSGSTNGCPVFKE